MTAYNEGDRVTVHPKCPGSWTDALCEWITGREGIIEEVKTQDEYSDVALYRVRFEEGFRPDRLGASTCSAWHCHEGDLRRAE